MFQFQYGTIKSLSQPIAVAHIFWFQFQYGTIKSTASEKRHDLQTSFNSNMVRLKERMLF